MRSAICHQMTGTMPDFLINLSWVAFPAMKPKISSSLISAGTTLTTALPCLVMITG